MNFGIYNGASVQSYASLWNKYRPVILKLMIDSATGTQQYKLSGHEFKMLNPKEKSGYTFSLQVYQGKAQNSIKESINAQDLLYMLTQSKKASELMTSNAYEFALDKQFNLSVTKVSAPAVEVI
jgi:hypothetical protein